ncbi:MAG: HAD family hydrolase [Propionibacteriaceae bacterium]|jgi:pyrophosphatase PpaX|nr:HAD family hydrolase [Propionibacteriaceae bacterium]
MPKAILFDLDGTLSDTVDLILDSYDHAVFEVLGRHSDREAHRHWIGRPLWDTFATLYGEEAAKPMVEIYDKWNMEMTPKLAKPFPGVHELLAELQEAGYRLGVVTAKRIHAAQLTVDSVGLGDVIQIAASASDTEIHKPNPEPLLKGAEVLGVDPADCVYVGDAVTDIQAAQAAQMIPIAVTWGAATEAELAAAGPAAIAHTAAELGVVLRQTT